MSTDHTQRRVTSLNSYYPHRAPPHPLHPLECSFLHSWYPDLAPPPPNCPCPTEFAKRSREPQPHRLRFPGPLRHFAKFAKLAKLKKTKKTPGKIENQFGENSRQNEFQFGENSRQNAVSPNWVSPNWGSPICPTHPPEPPQEQQALMLWQGQSRQKQASLAVRRNSPRPVQLIVHQRWLDLAGYTPMGRSPAQEKQPKFVRGPTDHQPQPPFGASPPFTSPR